MEAAKVDPKWWIFKITDELAEAIKAKDPAAIRKFYEDNEDLFKRIARRGIRLDWVYSGKYSEIDIEDAMRQIYADLPQYRYRNSFSIYYGVCDSVRYRNHGGFACHRSECRFPVSLEKQLAENLTLADVLAAPSDEDKPTIRQLIDFEKFLDKIALNLFPNSQSARKKFIARV